MFGEFAELDEQPAPDHLRRSRRELTYEMTLRMRYGAAEIIISGAFDDLCVDAIAGIVGVDGPVSTTVEIDASGVRHVVRGSAAELVAVAAERLAAGIGDIVITAISLPLASALADLGISTALPIALCGPSPD
jgi:hypothetical protein